MFLFFKVTYPIPRHQPSYTPEDLPRTVVFNPHQGSTITSMDFHPSHATLLLGIHHLTFSRNLLEKWTKLANCGNVLVSQKEVNLAIWYLTERKE